MSAIQYAIKQIHHTVPNEVLNHIFNNHYGYVPTTMDESIRRSILLDRVLVDIDIVGGQVINIHSSQANVRSVNVNEWIFQYNDTNLNGHEILSAHTFIVGDRYMNANIVTNSIPAVSDCPLDRSTIGQLGHSLVDASSKAIGPTVITDLRLVGKNTILMYNVNMLLEGWFRLSVTNDKELNNIHKKNWIQFGELVVKATEAYIYKTMRIAYGDAGLMGGQSTAGYTDYIDSIADSESEYKKLLKDWMAIAMMNDTAQYNEIIKLQINPFL